MKPQNRLFHAPTNYHACACRPKLQSRADAGWRLSVLLAWILLAGFAIAGLVLAATGCASPAERMLDQQTAATVAQIQAKNKVDVAHAKAKGTLNDTKATAAPVSHPIAATNQTVKRLRVPMEFVWPIATLLLFASIGLWFTSFKVVSKIGIPIFGAVSGGSLFELIALPYVPWLLYVGFGGVCVFLLYEIIRHRSVKAGLQAVITDIESEVYGLSGSTPPPPPPPPAASPASTSAPGPTSQSSFLTSLEAAGRNDLATAVTKIKSLLGIKTTAPAAAIAGSKQAPILTNTITPPAQTVPVPVK